MKAFIRGAIAVSLLALSGVASAQTTWNWAVSDQNGDSGSGTLTTGALSGGSYLVTGATGTIDGSAITLVAPNVFGANDNLLFPTAPELDLAGVSFLSSGGTYWNLAYLSAGYFYSTQPAGLSLISSNECAAPWNSYGSCTLTPQQVAGTHTTGFTANQAPEIDPTSALSALALLAGGLVVMRGRRQAA